MEEIMEQLDEVRRHLDKWENLVCKMHYNMQQFDYEQMLLTNMEEV